MSSHLAHIQRGLESMDIKLSENAQQQLLAYLELLQKWNQKMNLTGHQGMEKMIPYNLFDSLSILPLLKGKRVIDIGTGAGLPGIPLAIADPSRHYVLLDSRRKRVQFLRTVCRELGLNHVTPVEDRAERFEDAPFDTIVARAVAQARPLIDITEHLIAPEGQWLLMKGIADAEELQVINLPHQIERLTVPEVDGERCAIVVAQSG